MEEKTSSFGNLETERLKISKGGSDLQALEGEIARHKNQRAIASDNIISLEKKIEEESVKLKKYQEVDTEKGDLNNSRSDENEHQLLISKLEELDKQREDLRNEYKKKYPSTNEVPRPDYWSGWRLIPNEIEFWLDGDNRIHERLKYKFSQNKWDKSLLSP